MANTGYNLVNIGSGIYGAYNPQTQLAQAFSSEASAKAFFGTDKIDYSKASAPTFDVSKLLGPNADKMVSFAPSPSVNNNAPSTNDLGIGSATAPTLPETTANNVNTTYTESVNADLETKRKALEDEYNNRLKDIETKKTETQKKIDEFTATQKDIIETDVKPLTTPFRTELEETERERLYINENFEENQKLTNELETLLNEGNALIKEQKETTGLGSIRNPRVNQTISDVAARAGVIQAVMSARTGQIAEAYRLIDRSVAATVADRNDQLAYYQTLYNFYEEQKDTEGNKLVNLTNDEKTFINAKIGLLENDLKRAEETADYIKKLMTDPATASIVAQAGVTLNDSIGTINKKFADYTKREEQKAQQKVNREEAFKAGIATQFYNKQGTFVRTADGFAFESPEQFKEMTGMTIEEAQKRGLVSDYSIQSQTEKALVIDLAETYFDAGINPTRDSYATAVQKVQNNSRIYREKVRPPQGSGGGSNGLSETENATVNLYSPTVDQALGGGASPNEAVIAAVAIADATGTKLGLKEQNALLAYAQKKDAINKAEKQKQEQKQQSSNKQQSKINIDPRTGLQKTDPGSLTIGLTKDGKLTPISNGIGNFFK